MMQSKIQSLIDKGVKIANPASIELGADVDLARIHTNVTIHSGCRILGAKTLIEEGAVIGFEGPATIENCYIGRNVRLNGGYFSGAVCLAGVSCGLNAHIRPGTIMEEQASTAHSVGLKQTILFPFVTLGSLINFCDVFMAGGTSRKNHSEVGSSYIHFNYTPSGHKATASLLGNVPYGVMLNQRPIFLGGQGGMVGPCHFGFGVTTAAGMVIRKNEPKPDRLLFGTGAQERTSISNPERIEGIRKINKALIKANIIYLANLVALRHWYRHVRCIFVGPQFSCELYDGLCKTLEDAILERIKRLEEYGNALLADPNWQAFEKVFNPADKLNHFAGLRDAFVNDLKQHYDTGTLSYIDTIQSLEHGTLDEGTAWLQTIVDDIAERALAAHP